MLPSRTTQEGEKVVEARHYRTYLHPSVSVRGNYCPHLMASGYSEFPHHFRTEVINLWGTTPQANLCLQKHFHHDP